MNETTFLSEPVFLGHDFFQLGAYFVERLKLDSPYHLGTNPKVLSDFGVSHPATLRNDCVKRAFDFVANAHLLAHGR